MDTTGISTIAEILSTIGPLGFVAVLDWAFWRVNERKDKQMRELFDRLVELSEAQTAAVVKVEAALVALKEAIANLRRR